MKKIILSLFILLNNGLQAQNFFEGYIEYNVTYESFIPDISADDLKERMGTKHRYYVKNDNYIRESMDEDDSPVFFNIYIGKEKKTYDISIHNPDTIFYHPVTDTIFSISDIKEGGKEIILGHSCKSVSLVLSSYSNYLQDTSRIKLTYYFSDQLPVNPDWYKGYVYWADLVHKYKGIALKFSEEMVGYYKVTYTAVQIVKESLEDSLFEFDRSRYMKRVEY